MKNSQLTASETKEFATIVTIGTFDGVHVGHREIIKRLVKEADTNNLVATVLTFFPHPRMVLQQDANIKMINTLKEKKALLEEINLHNLVIHPFTKDFSRMTALEFVRDILVNKLNAKKVIVGYDHRFGRNRTADINDLITFGETYGFEVDQITAKEIDEVSVSSTKIRKALEAGDIHTANTYLGYSYILNGIVVSGKAIGRTIDFPTANLQIEEAYKLIPKNGVYVVQSSINGEKVYGMMNIGTKPTLDGKDRSLEIHFFDFEADLYGKELQVALLHRLRDEEKFDSIAALKEQLFRDEKNAKQFLKETNVK